MLLFPCREKGIILTHREYLENAKELLSFTGMKIIPIPEKAGAKYPNDILLNAAILGKYLIGKISALSKALLELSDEMGLIKVSVNQGYAKCSICKVSENAIITSDRSISSAAKAFGIDVLDIAQNGVYLEGYNCGFIGGASGNDGKNVFFCGDISLHPNGKEITRFCEKHGKNAVSLSKSPLIDVGTIFFVEMGNS